MVLYSYWYVNLTWCNLSICYIHTEVDAWICLEKLWLWLIVEKYLVANKQLPTSLTSTSLWYKSLFGSLHDEVHHDRIKYHNNKINFFHIHMIYFCADYKKWTCLCGNISYCNNVLITYYIFTKNISNLYSVWYFWGVIHSFHNPLYALPTYKCIL